LLEDPILLDLIGMRLAVPLPVAGIFRPPLLGAVIADLVINRICGNLVAMVFSSPPPPAFCRCANGLLRMTPGSVEGTLAKPARPLKHPSRVARFRFNQKYAGVI
jgi:hypothetical protein